MLDEVKDFTKETITKNENQACEKRFANLSRKKCLKELPELLPIHSIDRKRVRKGLCNYILPSPWCPRREKVFGDPKAEDVSIVSTF